MFIIGFLIFIFAISGLKLQEYIPAIAPPKVSTEGVSSNRTVKPTGECIFKESDLINLNVLGQKTLSVPYRILVSVEYSKLRDMFYQKPVFLDSNGEVFLARPVKPFMKMIEYLLDDMKPPNFENPYDTAEFITELNYWSIPKYPQTKV